MAELRAFFDDPRWPAAFVLAIATITVASLLAQRVRSRRVQRSGGSRAHRPWPATGGLAVSTAPASLVGLVPTQPIALVAAPPPPPPTAPPAVVPEQRRPLPDAPEPAEPVGTLLLAVTPEGPVGAARPAELLDLPPGLQVRIRRADIDPDALVAALPDDVAIHLDDLTAAPTDTTRNDQFRRSVDATRPRLSCAVILTGPTAGPPVVAVSTIDLQPLLAGDAQLAALLAGAAGAGARPDDRQAFDTALLAAARSRPVDAVLDLDGLRTDCRWIDVHHTDLRTRYGALLGGAVTAP